MQIRNSGRMSSGSSLAPEPTDAANLHSSDNRDTARLRGVGNIHTHIIGVIRGMRQGLYTLVLFTNHRIT